MALDFQAGDDLVFQLECGYGLLRVLAREGSGPATVWHLMAYEDLFPDVESAENALRNRAAMEIRKPHMALTDRAFERTPAARLGNEQVTPDELKEYEKWRNSSERKVHDRSALLMLGLR